MCYVVPNVLGDSAIAIQCSPSNSYRVGEKKRKELIIYSSSFREWAKTEAVGKTGQFE